MSRYIDADAYAAEMKTRQDACLELMNAAMEIVPVTRCAQCKWCDYPATNSTKYGCRLFDRCVKGDWFCADGERRTE